MYMEVSRELSIMAAMIDLIYSILVRTTSKRLMTYYSFNHLCAITLSLSAEEPPA